MISIRASIVLVLGLMGALLAAMLYVTAQQSRTAAMQAEAESRRTQSYRLAEQMRQSSNELTMMVRLYVASGEPRYRKFFDRILAIRSGSAPRPRDYDGSYWDRALAHGPGEGRDDSPRSLVNLMREAQFTDAEFSALNVSREASDALARIETEVMDRVPGIAAAPGTPEYAAQAQPLSARLSDADYYAHKDRIMAAVQRFIALVDARTLAQVEQARAQGQRWLGVQMGLLAALVLLSAFALFAASRWLVRPLYGLIEVTRRIAGGDYAQRVKPRSVSELRALGDRFNDMAGAIQTDIARRQQAEAAALEAQAAAERANQAKSAFLANMSHEIRTPLNAVIGMSEILCETGLDEEQRDCVNTINSSGSHLLAVINDILDFSKVESGMLELEEQAFDLRRTVEESLELVAAHAAEKRLDLVYEFAAGTPEIFKGDRGRVRQILVNYLSNAIKFTERGDVLVSVTATPREDGRHDVRVAVRDTGVGISQEGRERLFKSFSQVDASTTRRYGGTGLGLAICKRLAELMSGSVDVDSHPGLGSIFSFSFVAEADAERRAAPRPDISMLVAKRLLVVDDNETNRRIVRAMAQDWGMRVVDVASGAEALDLFERGDRFDLAALDFLMPDMDGVELAAEIRRRELRELPLLLLSSVRRTARALPDFNLVLTKPLRRAAMLDAFRELLSPPIEPDLSKPQVSTPAAPVAALRVLLVEDNPVNQKVALRMLAMLGYAADLAENGLEAVQAVERERYDLVLMDVQMPVMDGLEATRRIRRLPPRRQPRIFAMTASVLDSDRQDCIDAGMERHLAKPIRRQQLAEALAEVSSDRGLVPAASARVAAAPSAAEAATSVIVDADTQSQFLREMGKEGAIEVIDAIVAGADEARASLRQLLAEGDHKPLKRRLHTLKSNCAMVGALQLSDACAKAEQMAASESLQGLEGGVAEIERQYGDLAVYLAQWRVTLGDEAQRV